MPMVWPTSAAAGCHRPSEGVLPPILPAARVRIATSQRRSGARPGRRCRPKAVARRAARRRVRPVLRSGRRRARPRRTPPPERPRAATNHHRPHRGVERPPPAECRPPLIAATTPIIIVMSITACGRPPGRELPGSPPRPAQPNRPLRRRFEPGKIRHKGTRRSVCSRQSPQRRDSGSVTGRVRRSVTPTPLLVSAGDSRQRFRDEVHIC